MPNLRVPGRRGNKHGARRSRGSGAFPEIRDRNFDSGFEADVAQMLCIRLYAKEISDLQFQPTISLTEAHISWKIDFSYIENGQLYYHEAKGFGSREYALKLKLYKVYGPAPLRVQQGSKTNSVTKEYIPTKGGE